MNNDILEGEGRDIGGKIKETAGDVVGSPGLQAEGLGDQLAGKAQKVAGTMRDAVKKKPHKDTPRPGKFRLVDGGGKSDAAGEPAESKPAEQGGA